MVSAMVWQVRPPKVRGCLRTTFCCKPVNQCSGHRVSQRISVRLWSRSESRRVVLKLSALFILDAFAGGFVMQSLIVFWFKQRFSNRA